MENEPEAPQPEVLAESEPALEPVLEDVSQAESPPEPKPSKAPKFVPEPWMIFTLLAIVVLVGGYFIFTEFFPSSSQSVATPMPSQTECTLEAKLCPDGSFVGRTGPNCEFAACPIIEPDFSSWKTYRNTEYGFEFKYPNWLKSGKFNEADILRATDKTGGSITILIMEDKLDPTSIISELYGPIPLDSLHKENIGDHTTYSYSDGDAGCGGNRYLISIDEERHLALHFSDCEMDEPYIRDEEDKILSTFKFIDAQSASTWKTYRNEELGFEFMYPYKFTPTLELDDEYNRLTTFGSSEADTVFEVRLEEDTDPNMGVMYGYLGAEITSSDIKLGDIVGFEAISTTGYCDGPGCGKPYVVFAARYNGDVYHLMFYGDAIISAEENQILSTFKFIEN